MPKLRHSGPAAPIAEARLRTSNHYGPEYRHPHVIYYLRFRDLVKIGITQKIRQRINAIPNEGLLVVEFGNIGQERDRHRQFNHLRRTGEWFEFGPELGAHIADLRERFHQEQGLTVEEWFEARSKPLRT